MANFPFLSANGQAQKSLRIRFNAAPIKISGLSVAIVQVPEQVLEDTVESARTLNWCKHRLRRPVVLMALNSFQRPRFAGPENLVYEVKDIAVGRLAWQTIEAEAV